MKDASNNNELVEFLHKEQIVKTPAILQAFRSVDRGEFTTPSLRSIAYRNRPVRHGKIHLSAPFIYAKALEAFRLQPGMSFLNIGSGTCYLSYLVSMLIGELGVNHGVEVSSVVLEHSSRCVAKADQSLGRMTDMQILCGNGLNIETESGYDCVYVGAGCEEDTTMDYLQGLLTVGGVMVAPFGDELVRVQRMEDGSFHRTTLCNVVFSPIVMPPTATETPAREMAALAAAVPLRFVERPWSPDCHPVYPEPFREIVLAVLLASSRANTLPNTIPPALWMEIMSFAKRDWFSKTAQVGLKDLEGSGEKSGCISQDCLCAVRRLAMVPIKIGCAAAAKLGYHVS